MKGFTKILVSLALIVALIENNDAALTVDAPACFQCATASACATATSEACTDTDATYCKSVFDSENEVTSKSCATSCEEDDTTTCCNDEDGCNTANTKSVGSCYTCTGGTGCSSTTETCSESETVCLSTYSNYNAVTKSCATSCIQGMLLGTGATCCYTDKCNSGLVEKANLSVMLMVALVSSLFVTFRSKY